VTVTGSGPTTKLNYNAGSCLNPAQKYQYQTKYIQIPTLDLLYGVGKADLERVAIAEAKVKEAEAKVAAEILAKVKEAEAKVAAEILAKREAEVKAAVELKAKQEAEAKAAVELRAKQEAEAKVFVEQKLTLDVIELEYKIDELGRKFPSQKPILDKYIQSLSLWSDSQFRITGFAEMLKESKRINAELGLLEVKWNKSKKTISCVKGNKSIKVTDVKPVCPAGYRKK
jgi:uncharacterized protein YfbU (UPF0304 family)